MTTTVKVSVNGNFRATVKQDGNEDVVVGPGESRSFPLPHPANSTFTISEEEFDPNARQDNKAGKDRGSDDRSGRAKAE
jgi:hypothetical protein